MRGRRLGLYLIGAAMFIGYGTGGSNFAASIVATMLGSDTRRGGDRVSTFTWPIRIANLDGEQSLDIDAFVDTGALMTTVPASMLEQLGVERVAKQQFTVADGRRLRSRYWLRGYDDWGSEPHYVSAFVDE